MAHELGYFKKFGIESIVSKEASWAVIRDKLSLGENQATHMLIGMPLASTMGLAGSPVKPMVIPWLLNRNGQAITLNNKLKQAGVRKPQDVKPLAEKAKAAGEPLAFAMTFPPGTHAMWMRYWLAAGGVHPDKDVSLITIPPPQMVANMKVDKMDGFCVGEPWNNRAIEDGIGFTVTTTQQMWKDHPEKVCAFTEEFATKNPKTVKAILKALHLASVDLDKMENRPKFAEVISRPAYINCPPAIILERLMGKYEYGDGRVEQDPFYMIYSNRNCNYPHQIYAKWWLSQFRRWGMTKGAPDYTGIPKRVLRSDIYLEAMKEMGVPVKVAEEQSITLFDGVFDGKDPEKYARVVPDSRAAGIGESIGQTARQFPLAALRHRARSRDLVGRQPNGSRSAVAGADMGREQALYPRAAHEAGRNRSGDPAARLLQPGASRARLPARDRHRDTNRVPARRLVDAHEDVRSDHAGAAPDLAARVAATRPGIFQKSEPAALFAIAVCSMWPTVINTMLGVRAIPQDYWNVARVLRLSRMTTFTKIIIPATLPYMFTGYRLSLGIAWLVIVASEMLTGTPGVGGFLWQEYNSLVYAHILLAIITIGVVGFALDRLMGMAEARLRAV